MAIHDQDYVRYDGPLRESGAWWVIAWTGFRTYLGFGRTKLTLIVLWLVNPLFFLGLVFLEYVLRGQMGQMGDLDAPAASYITGYLQVEAFSLAVLFMARGCGVISEDLRYRTFQLYFSKPISRADYAVGKFGSLFLLGSLVTVLPSLIVGGLRLAFFFQTDFFKGLLAQVGIGVALSIFITIVFCGIVAGLSSTTERTGYVVLSWIGVLLVPFILQGIVYIATSGADMASLWSLTGELKVFSDMLLLDDFAFEGPAWLAPSILIVAGGAGIAAMIRRISSLEGVA